MFDIKVNIHPVIDLVYYKVLYLHRSNKLIGIFNNHINICIYLFIFLLPYIGPSLGLSSYWYAVFHLCNYWNAG